MKRFLRKGVVPPGGRVRYRDPDDGWEYAHPYYGRVVLLAHAHRVSAGLPIPHDWEQWVEDQICRATSAACIEADPAELARARAETSPGWLSMAAHFAGAMLRWAASGFATVSWDAFKARMTICRGDPDTDIPRCPHYHPSQGGWSFVHCGKCGCARQKLFLASEKCPLGKW